MSMIPYFPAGYGLCRYKFSEAASGRVMGCSMGHLVPLGEEQITAAFLSDQFNEHILQNGVRLGNTWTFIGVSLEVNTTAEANEMFEHAENQPGLHTGATLPPNCAQLIAKRTGLVGRRYRGRLFVPAGVLFDTEVSNAGVISSAITIPEQGQYTDWLEACAAVGDDMQLFHQYDPVLLQTPVAPTPLTALSVLPLIATQRRRLR